jgi:hypothetical protein
MPRSNHLALVAVVSLLVAACGVTGTPPSPSPATPPVGGYPGWPPNATFELIPIPVSTELVAGENRMLVNLVTSENEPLASPDRPVDLQLYDLAADPATPAVTAEATYLPTVEGRPGLYRAQVNFPRAGEWGLEAIAHESDGSTRTGRMVFPVREVGTTPAIGAPAIASETPTAQTEADIAQISTDDDPDPDFYVESVDQALEAGEPFALIFATPAFCATAACGPTLDLVKAAAADYKDQMAFIHVEPYELDQVEGRLQPVLDDRNLPIPVPAVNEWGLQTEPYVFVVDGDGNVSAKFEGIASDEELRAAFEAAAN